MGVLTPKQKVSAVITDLDNTLFNWFEFWYHSFREMLTRVSVASGVPLERLIDEARDVHKRHGMNRPGKSGGSNP